MQHGTSTNCWTIIVVNGEKRVYDITSLVRHHEGGSSVIKSMCGVDGSIGFWCVHDLEELEESVRDGDAREMCRVPKGQRRRRLDDDEEEDDDDDDDDDDREGHDDEDEEEDEDEHQIKASCASGGTLPTPPATTVLASDVAEHKTAQDCWTSLSQGGVSVVVDLSKYAVLHPGGKAIVMSGMCGKDGTAAYVKQHSLMYITQGIQHGHITVLGSLSGEYPSTAPNVTVLPTITSDQLALHGAANDCWGRIGEWVVDMTGLRNTHPAGNSMLLCGKDVTGTFRLQHADIYIERMPVQGLYADACVGCQPTLPPAAAPAPSPNITDGSAGPAPAPAPSLATMFSSVQLSQHAVPGDCWVAVSCNIYNMTAFIPYHSGDRTFPPGEGSVGRMCGKDGTGLFESVHPRSYLGLAVNMGAELLGVLGDCGATGENTSHAPLATGIVLWYTLRFAGLDSAAFNLTDPATERSLRDAVYNQMTSAGMAGVGIVVTNLRPGSIIADIGFELPSMDLHDEARQLGDAALPALSWNGASPLLLGEPRLNFSDAAPAPAPSPLPPGSPASPGPSPSGSYTLQQVQDHNTKLDCWLAVNGKVYSFVGGGTTHPHKTFFALGLCGTDATDQFDLRHPVSYLEQRRLNRVGGGQIGTLAAAMPPKHPLPSPIEVLPSKEVLLLTGGTDFLQRHNSPLDCWMAFYGKVYVATPMLQQHEGGRGVVESLCGLDATASLDCVHPRKYLDEATEDYGIYQVGSIDSALGVGCTFDASSTSTTVLTWADVAEHSTLQNCWAVVGSAEGLKLVWDLTAFIPKHSGGATSIGSHCGGDASSAFEKQHREGYLTTMEQKGAKVVGRVSGAPPPPSVGNVQLAPLNFSDVAQHSLAQDCWVAVHGFVLDVTGFISLHSGGMASIEAACGTEATAVFESAGHTFGYVTMMTEKGWAHMKGCVGSCSAGGGVVEGTGTNTEVTANSAVVSTRQCRTDEPVPPAVEVQPMELERHVSPKDCWMVLGCGVYDVSAYTHTGGNIVFSYCGTDGTASFLGKHPVSYLHVLISRGAVLKGTFAGTPLRTSVGRKAPISLLELSKHNTIRDCWTCVLGKVYELHYYMPSHDGGSAVISPMCGNDATQYFLLVHHKAALAGLPVKGDCMNRAEEAYTEQNILDAVAFGLYLLPVAFFVQCSGWLSMPMQDRCLRRAVARPLKCGPLAKQLNTYLEMPRGVAFLLLWFLAVTTWAMAVWTAHYNTYYLPEFAGAGAVGRVTVYMVTIATYLGTRRWSFSWWLWKVSYEKTLKAHYVVGYVASIFILVHGGMYLWAFGADALPEHQATSAYTLLTLICIIFPLAAVTGVRVHFYWLFKVSHFLAPALVFVVCFHILSLSVDGQLGRGFYTVMIWVGSSAALWLIDFLSSRFDALLRPVSIIDGPAILMDDGVARGSPPEQYIRVKLEKRITLFPGAWLQVICPNAGSALGHPFTAIVRRCGGIDGRAAEVEFIWKVGKNRSWTRNLSNAIKDKGSQGTAGSIRFFLSGPYGGGLAGLEAMNVLVFVVAGVGVTPAASMVPHLLAAGKEVHIIWTARSAALLSYVGSSYFDSDPHFARYPHRRHIHFTAGLPEERARMMVPAYVKLGRPNIGDELQKIAQDALSRRIFDVGVFVCGPSTLVTDTVAAAEQINRSGARSTYIHVHSESFQM